MPAKLSKAGKYVAFNVSGLSEINAGLDYSGDEVMEYLTLTGSVVDLDVSGCTALRAVVAVGCSITAVDISGSPEIVSLGIEDNALPETQVDAILAALDLAGKSNGYCGIDQGTNAPPSASGLTSKSNLEAKGWTVYVNP